jgi:GNAT superfamily N-acetyltransferase
MIGETLGVHITHTRPEHCKALAKLQRVIFPMLTEDELLTEAMYRKHLKVFPDGQMVALLNVHGKAKVVGATSTLRTNFNFDDIQHTFLQAIAGGWLTNHLPHGEWLYGADMGVHPDYRGLKIGSRFYETRRQLVKRLKLRGEIAGAMLPGYCEQRKRLSIEEYVRKVVSGDLKDPTLSFQLKNGFKVRGILYHHYESDTHPHAALIVRENPDL